MASVGHWLNSHATTHIISDTGVDLIGSLLYSGLVLLLDRLLLIGLVTCKLWCLVSWCFTLNAGKVLYLPELDLREAVIINLYALKPGHEQGARNPFVILQPDQDIRNLDLLAELERS